MSVGVELSIRARAFALALLLICLPQFADAAVHGAGIFKNPMGPDGTPRAHVGDTITVPIRIQNLDTFGDSLTFTNLADVVHHQTGDIKTSNLLGGTITLTNLNDTFDVVHTYSVLTGDASTRSLLDDASAGGVDNHDGPGGTHFPQNFFITFPGQIQILSPCIQVTKACTTGQVGFVTFSGSVSNCGNTLLTNIVVSNFVNGAFVYVLGPTNLDTNQVILFTGSYQPANPCQPASDTLWAWGTDGLSLTLSNSAGATCPVTSPPALICQPNKTVECGSAWNFDAPTSTNAVTVAGTVTNGGSCPAPFSVTRTWRATDSCSNTTTCSQTVTTVDTTPPNLSCPANRIVECGAPWNFGVPNAVDACSGTNVVVIIVSTITNRAGFCGNNLSSTRTWRATDSCSNISVCSQTVTVVDTTPPSLIGVPTNQTYCQLSDVPPLPVVTASDNCGTSSVLRTSATNGAAPTIIVNCWQAFDQCSNVVTACQTNLVLNSSGAIGDFVWQDLNRDGVQDDGEPGAAAGTVQLLDCASNLLATTTTDANGRYLFTNLIPSTYVIRFVAPPGYTFSPSNIGADDTLDSDPSEGTGFTTCVNLGCGETNLTVDAGLTQNASLAINVDNQPVTSGNVTRTNSAQISFQTNFPNERIFYTLDGSDPNSGLLYTGPFVVAESSVVSATAYTADYLPLAEANPVVLTIVNTPVIRQQPQGQQVATGSPALFSVGADGTEPLSYQWLRNALPVPGATNANFLLAAAALADVGSYSVRVSNDFGTALSASVNLSVLDGPQFISQPTNQNVAPGATVTFCAGVTGAPPILYQWRKNGENLPGQTNACITITNAQLSDGGSYNVIAANPAGLAVGDSALLTIQVTQVPPGDNFSNRVQITGNNGSVAGRNLFATREPGEPNHAGEPGAHSVWYTWRPSNSGVATFSTIGSSFDTLLGIYTGTNVAVLTVVGDSDDSAGSFFTSQVRFNAIKGTNYQIAIDGFGGREGDFVLSWQLAQGQIEPVIAVEPVSLTAPLGSDAAFVVGATGAALTYQWLFEGKVIAGATNASLVRTNVQPSDVGAYSVQVASHPGQTNQSHNAILEIGDTPGVRSHDKFEDLFGAPAVVAPFNLKSLDAISDSGFISVSAGTLQSQIFTTIDSTTQTGETNHCARLGGSSQWFGLQPLTDGTMVIDTEGSGFDTVMAVYTGTNLSSFQLITCNDNAKAGETWSRVAFAAKAGTQYAVAVDGVNGAKGIVPLRWGLGSAPTVTQSSPRSVLARVGGGVTFTTQANGTPTPNIQWRLGAASLSGANNSTLALTNVQVYHGGTYSVELSNFVGAITNKIANLQVDASLTTSVQSVFDSDGDGWGVLNDADPLVYHASGGNPGGYVTATDRQLGLYWYWLAPRKYLGNQSASYGGLLQFDLKQDTTLQQQDQSDIIMTGGGLTLVFNTLKNPGTNWTSYKVALSELAGWRIASLDGPAPNRYQMLRVLSSLTLLAIRAEFTTLRDTDGLDNVALLAPPTNSTPILVSQRFGNQLILQWPASATGFQLQAGTIASRTAWSNVLSASFNLGGLMTVSNSLTDRALFYRLARP